MNERLFISLKELADSGYIFRITDNGGATLDRITVIFCDGDHLSLSETGAGVSMWGEGIDVAGWNDRVEAGTEVDLAIGDLRPELQDHILRRVNEAWQDYLDALNDPHGIATAPGCGATAPGCGATAPGCRATAPGCGATFTFLFRNDHD